MDPTRADGDGDGPGVGRGRGWFQMQTQHVPEYRALRRPHNTSATTGIIGTADHTALNSEGVKDDIVKNSTLSVDAAEFVPKSYSAVLPAQPVSAWPRHSVQDRLNFARQTQQAAQVQQVQQRQMVQHQHYVAQQQQHNQRYMLQQQHQHHHRYMGAPQQQQYNQYANVQEYGGSYDAGSGDYNRSQQQQYNQYANVQDYGSYDGGSGDHNRSQREQQGMDSAADEREMDVQSMMAQLEVAMRSLTLSPGRFDSLVAPLVDAIIPYLTQPPTVEAIVRAVLRESIEEGNFRYSGARLCTFLDNATLGERSATTFRDTLLTRCREETEKRVTAWMERGEGEEEEGERFCHGLILFLAELVAQMESEPASVLGKLLIRLISAVLQRPAQNSAKFICQALKLAGQILERENSGSGGEMENVMRSLTGLVTKGLVDIHVGRMVNSVDELRRGNWGRVRSAHGPFTTPTPATPADSSPRTTSNADGTQNPFQHLSNEPVFYGPDGNILSPEESRFLQDLTADRADTQGYGEAEGEDDEADIQAMWEEEADDGGMDEDIEAAYEQFLKLTPNSSNGRARR